MTRQTGRRKRGEEEKGRDERKDVRKREDFCFTVGCKKKPKNEITEKGTGRERLKESESAVTDQSSVLLLSLFV